MKQTKQIKQIPPNDLKRIPGVGKAIEQHFFNIGIHSLDDLKGANPDELFAKDAAFKGKQDCRCLLYVFRLAMYYANNDAHEIEKLRWEYWKDSRHTD